MTDSMVERVARAILARIEQGWPEVEAEDPVQDDYGSSPFVSGGIEAGGYVLIDGRVKPLDIARAAIEAMREPTETMIEAAHDKCGWVDFDTYREKYTWSWQAMIAAALAEPK